MLRRRKGGAFAHQQIAEARRRFRLVQQRFQHVRRQRFSADAEAQERRQRALVTSQGDLFQYIPPEAEQREGLLPRLAQVRQRIGAIRVLGR